MATLKDIAKEVGLCPLKVDSGASIDTMPLIEAMFAEITEQCRQGEEVKIKDFGSFKVKINRGRTIRTPLVEGGEIKSGDILLLKYHQANKSKKRLNEDKNVENFGGTYVEKAPRPSDLKKEEDKKKKKPKAKAESKVTKPPKDKVVESETATEEASVKKKAPKKSPKKKTKKAPPAKNSKE